MYHFWLWIFILSILQLCVPNKLHRRNEIHWICDDAIIEVTASQNSWTKIAFGCGYFNMLTWKRCTSWNTMKLFQTNYPTQCNRTKTSIYRFFKDTVCCIARYNEENRMHGSETPSHDTVALIQYIWSNEKKKHSNWSMFLSWPIVNANVSN